MTLNQSKIITTRSIAKNRRQSSLHTPHWWIKPSFITQRWCWRRRTNLFLVVVPNIRSRARKVTCFSTMHNSRPRRGGRRRRRRGRRRPRKRRTRHVMLPVEKSLHEPSLFRSNFAQFVPVGGGVIWWRRR